MAPSDLQHLSQRRTDWATPSAEEECAELELVKIMQIILRGLTRQEKRVLLHLILEESESDLARDLGVKLEKARLLKEAALARIRRKLKKRGFCTVPTCWPF
ncbi:MAG: hypothetical protein KGZ30_00455 [Anaplasmataceae bacterium]|nr:hypothetical protein [Anaplasmataceae bacterium]